MLIPGSFGEFFSRYKKAPSDGVSSTSICRLRWTYPLVNLGNMSVRTCCRTPSYPVDQKELKLKGKDALFNSKYLRTRRLEMLKGVKHSDCNSCWNLESSGVDSPRLGKSDFEWYAQGVIGRPKEQFGDHFKKIKSNSTFLNANNPDMLEIIVGNQCDLKCSYCHYHYSSKWAAELIKFGDLSKDQLDREFPEVTTEFNDAFWDWYIEDGKNNLKFVNFIGGEPLLTPKFYEYLDRLRVIHKNSDTRPVIGIVTNLNTPPEQLDKFIRYLQSLVGTFKVDLNISMESVGQRAEYIRFGLNWQRWEANLRKILDLNLGDNLVFSFQMAINAMCITSLKDFLVFTKDLYDEYGVAFSLRRNIVSFPEWQSPTILTEEFKEDVQKSIDFLKEVEPKVSYDPHSFGPWNRYIQFLETVKDGINTSKNKTALRAKFYTWFNEHDRRRKSNFIKTFPEYTKFWEQCREIDQKRLN